MRKLPSHLLEPRSMILGFSTFYYGWAFSMWNRAPLWDYHSQMFIGTVFLISAAGLALNRRWSNLVAAILSGQWPLAFLAEFWMLSQYAEVTTFSAQHFEAALRGFAIGSLTPLLWLSVSVVILSYSVLSIIRRPTER